MGTSDVLGIFLITRCRASLSWAVHKPWQSAMFPLCRPVTHTNVNESVVCRNFNCQHFIQKTGLKQSIKTPKSHIPHNSFRLSPLYPPTVSISSICPALFCCSSPVCPFPQVSPTAFNEVTLTSPCRLTVESNAPVPPLAQRTSCLLSEDTLRSLMRDSAFVMFELQGRVSLNQDAVLLHILCGNPLCFDPAPFHGPNGELWSQNFSRLHQTESPGCILYGLSNAHAVLTGAHTCFWIPISTGGDLKSLIVMYIAWKHMEKNPELWWGWKRFLMNQSVLRGENCECVGKSAYHDSQCREAVNGAALNCPQGSFEFWLFWSFKLCYPDPCQVHPTGEQILTQ